MELLRVVVLGGVEHLAGEVLEGGGRLGLFGLPEGAGGDDKVLGAGLASVGEDDVPLVGDFVSLCGDNLHASCDLARQVVLVHELGHVSLDRLGVGEILDVRGPLGAAQTEVVLVLLKPDVLVGVVPHASEVDLALEGVRVDAVILANLHGGESGDAAADDHHLMARHGVRVGGAHLYDLITRVRAGGAL